MKKRKGQVLILILLVVVVALSVGLSIASRNVTNLKTSTQSEQSQRVFTAAEGGVEDILSQLDTLRDDATIAAGGTRTFTPDVGDIDPSVEVRGSLVYEALIDLGEVGQIDLDNSPGSLLGAGTNIQIEWAKLDEASETASDGPASIEVTQVYGASPFSQTRYFFQGVSGRANESVGISPGGFTSAGACNSPSGRFQRCAVITTQATPQVLRVKPFWVKTTVRVYASGANLPVQVYDVASTATSGFGVTRRVQVTRTALPHLPAVFDYALFSERDIIK